MIGVVADPADHDVVREFFELFKTPWEFSRTGQRYEVLLCAGESNPCTATANVVLVYAGQSTHVDIDMRVPIHTERANTTLSYRDTRIPIYGKAITFREEGVGLPLEESSRKPAVYVTAATATVLVRIGYDLFREVRTLLTAGQPPLNASLPTLELHIALLRDLIVGSGVPLVEIPPVPDGHPFIACLTHDVDHPSIRYHKWDHTTFGFLYRASLGSMIKLCRGRVPARDLLTNWVAALTLPLVHLGLLKDFWSDFDRYPEIERGLHSTFFVIPFKGAPGRTATGQAPARRASPYAASDIAGVLRRLIQAG